MYFRFLFRMTCCLSLGMIFTHNSLMAASEEALAIIKIQPDRCGFSEPNEHCEMLLKLRWIAKKFGNYCLYSQGLGKDKELKQLKCWENRSKARFEIEFKSADSILYILKSDKKTLAAKKVTVAKVTRRLNRRRRRPWHLF